MSLVSTSSVVSRGCCFSSSMFSLFVFVIWIVVVSIQSQTFLCLVDCYSVL